eukprot:5133042-Amphidinium_carterae.1
MSMHGCNLSKSTERCGQSRDLELLGGSSAVGVKSRVDNISAVWSRQGWTIYYIAHLLAATSPALFAHSIYPTGIIFIVLA